MDAGSMTAAPSPCTSRAPTRTPSVGAHPQAAEAAMNSANPAAYA